MLGSGQKFGWSYMNRERNSVGTKSSQSSWGEDAIDGPGPFWHIFKAREVEK